MNDNAPATGSRMGRARARRKRRQLLALYGPHCWLCHRPIAARGRSFITIDHIMPVSRGGSHHLDNLRLAHFSCNQARGDGPVPELLLTRDMRVDPRPRPMVEAERIWALR